MTYAFIINRDRLTLPARMADYLAGCPGITPIIVDNGSTYEPLLDYYARSPHTVELMGANYGNTVLWYTALWDKYDLDDQRYIVTDPDLDLSGVPTDFLTLLNDGLDRYHFATKAGFSLETNDIPDTTLRWEIMGWEADKWAYPLDEQFYRADIDTTFALYRQRLLDFPAVRTARPYTARHVPWYYVTAADVPEDERYYITHCGGWSFYTVKIKELLGL